MKKTIRHIKRTLAAAICAGLIPMAVAADTPLGTWLTPPDANGIVAHIEAQPCGAAACGVIARTYDSQGRPVQTPNLGVRVFWDMTPAGAGVWTGRAFVPAHNRSYTGTMKVRGNRMTVRGCLGPVCQSQVWARVN
ncbi:DUF2147 domain-containing protein [Antarcticimicrobium luteum]|uniref:DUF2147 domain-containing protein n=1 Tax=Antarcticimicrobium luteum TaxID=2547397 RepID=UPI00140DCD38|nr:DUF2147 domain-containing protein [Antarcticimicrobium luteum]